MECLSFYLTEARKTVAILYSSAPPAHKKKSTNQIRTTRWYLRHNGLILSTLASVNCISCVYINYSIRVKDKLNKEPPGKELVDTAWQEDLPRGKKEVLLHRYFRQFRASVKKKRKGIPWCCLLYCWEALGREPRRFPSFVSNWIFSVKEPNI